MSNNSLRNIILTGLFAIPFVPLLVSTSLFFPFITGKAFAFRIIVEIIFVCYLVLCLRNSEYRPKFSWIYATLLLFLIVIGIADLFGENPFKSFWSNYERMEGFVTLLHLGAYFVVLASIVKTRQLWDKLLSVSIFASTIMGIYCFFQIAGLITINQGGVRVDGTFGNAAYLAIYNVFHIFIAAILYFRTDKRWQRILLAIVALINLIVLYYTATRGAVLGLLGGAFISFLFLGFKAPKGSKIRKIALSGLGLLIVFIGLFFAFRNTSFVKDNLVLQRFASLSPSEFKTQGRYYVWPIALKGISEKPLLGWGQEGFNFVFNKYYDPRMYTQEQWFDRAHSTPLDWLIAGGILGFLSYALIFAAIFYYIFKSNKENLSGEEKSLMLGLILAYIFNNLFVFDQIGSYICFFMIMAFIHSNAEEDERPFWNRLVNGVRQFFNKETSRSIIEAVFLIILLVSLYFFNYIPWKENLNLISTLKISSGQGTLNMEALEKPLANYNMGFPESLEQESQLAISIAQNSSAASDVKQKVFQLVDKAFQEQVKRVPNDARYRLFYGLFLSRFQLGERAIEQLNIAKSLSPRKQSILFEIANNYLLLNRPQDALDAARTAYELEPDFEEAKLIYGYTAVATKNTEVAQKILGSVVESKVIFDDRYLAVLQLVNDYQKIVEVVKRRIELDPSNNQHRITLAAAFLEWGKRTDAIRTIEEIIKIDPSFKDKGEYFISEIKAGRNP